jgi:hypothetical protein
MSNFTIEKIYLLLELIQEHLYDRTKAFSGIQVDKALYDVHNPNAAIILDATDVNAFPITTYMGIYVPILVNKALGTNYMEVKIYARKSYKENKYEQFVYGFESVFYFDNLEQIAKFLYRIDLENILYNLSHTDFDIIKTDKYSFKAKYKPEDNTELIQLKNKLELAKGLAYV